MQKDNTSESEKISSVGEAADFAAGSLNNLADEIHNSGIFDRTDIQNPLDIIEYKRGKIDKDDESLRRIPRRCGKINCS